MDVEFQDDQYIQDPDTTGQGGGFSSWSDGLFGALGTVGSAAFGVGDAPQNVTYVTSPAAPTIVDNTKNYMIAGVVLLVVGLIVFAVIKGSKSKGKSKPKA